MKQLKSNSLKSAITIFGLAMTLVAFLTGCGGPTKTGGGGKQQPFNPNNGQYN